MARLDNRYDSNNVIIRYIRDLGASGTYACNGHQRKEILNQEVLTILCDDGVHISKTLH